MSQSATQAAIAQASRVAHSLLKADGFTRRGNHLFRDLGGTIQAFNFQSSRWGSRDSGSFTVNLVVTSEWLYTCWIGRCLPANPATALFPIQMRIGSLMPEQRDWWWEVSETTNLENLATEVANVLVNVGLPFLERFGTPEAMLQTVRESRGLPGLTPPMVTLVHAILAAQIGCANEAREQLAKADLDAANSPFAATVRSIRERLQLRMPTL